jgi:hypothetical protein
MEKTVKCDKNMTFADCELEILKNSITLAENKIGRNIVQNPEVKEMINIVENFIKDNKLVCYGGTAINALLPDKDKFYNKDYELSDYDFFSENALDDAKKLADIFYKNGYEEVEAKSGMHKGTYKVFCQFFPMADITQVSKNLFKTLQNESIKVDGILYAPPNFLRMSMYGELSKPYGEVDRWIKVFKRLTLINKYYPLTKLNCFLVDFQRKMETENKINEDVIYKSIRDTLIDNGNVFFGGYAISNYSRYMNRKKRNQVLKIADFDVLSNNPMESAEKIKVNLNEKGIENVKILKRPAVWEIIPEQIEIRVGIDVVAVLYKPNGCYSYNSIKINGKTVKIATIDTMLTFYLSFLYANKPYYDKDRIVCMANYLFEVQHKNRLKQKGLLRRFSVTCYGHMDTLEEIKMKKSNVYKVLSQNKNSREYEEWFLNYKPGYAKNNKTNQNKTQKIERKTQKSSKSRKNRK